MNVSIEKALVECYRIRFTGEFDWADITLDAGLNGHSGRIQIASDYGSWENYWGACGSSFKQFLISLNIEYAAGKFGAGRWFDHDKTIEKLREAIENCDESDEVKEQMNLDLDNLEGCEDEGQFEALAYSSPVLHKLWDTGPEIVTDINPSFKRFWEKIWLCFVEKLKKEVAA